MDIDAFLDGGFEELGAADPQLSSEDEYQQEDISDLDSDVDLSGDSEGEGDEEEGSQSEGDEGECVIRDLIAPAHAAGTSVVSSKRTIRQRAAGAVRSAASVEAGTTSAVRVCSDQLRLARVCAHTQMGTQMSVMTQQSSSRRQRTLQTSQPLQLRASL